MQQYQEILVPYLPVLKVILKTWRRMVVQDPEMSHSGLL
jgi:hypothetical protein